MYKYHEELHLRLYFSALCCILSFMLQNCCIIISLHSCNLLPSCDSANESIVIRKTVILIILAKSQVWDNAIDNCLYSHTYP